MGRSRDTLFVLNAPAACVNNLEGACSPNLQRVRFPSAFFAATVPEECPACCGTGHLKDIRSRMLSGKEVIYRGKANRGVKKRH